MWRSEERSELTRAVLQRGEAVGTVAARLGVPVSTARSWIRAERAGVRAPAPTFMEVVAEVVAQPTIVIRVGSAEIEVRGGVDSGLLRQVMAALGGDS